MRINKSLLIISMIFISLLALGAVNAMDDSNSVESQLSVADEVEINEDAIQDTDNLLSEEETGEDEIQDTDNSLSAGDTDEDDPIVVNIKNATSYLGGENIVGYDENITIEIEVNDKSFDLTQNKVQLKIAGKSVSDVNIDSATGKGSYVVPSGTYDQGTYYVEAVLVDVANQKVISGNNFFTVDPAEVDINVKNVEAVTGAGVNIPINITNRKDGKGSNGVALVTIFYYTAQGELKNITKEVTVVNGTGVGTFDMSMLMGMMGGMMNGNNSDWSKMFNGSGGGIGSMFKGGSMIPSGPSGMSMKSSDVKFNYYFLVGNYTATIEFLENRNYAHNTNTLNITITYPDVLYYVNIVQAPQKAGDVTVAYVMVMDKYGTPLPNKVLSYDLDGKESGNVTLDENASATIIFNNVLNGNHKLTMSSNATGNVTNGTYEFAVSIPKVDIKFDMKDTSVAAIDTSIDGNSGKYFTITLKDASGNTLANKKVIVTLNSKKYELTTDAQGIAKVQLNIAKANTYIATVCYLGDESYNSAVEMAKVTVKKQTPKLTTAKKTYKAKAKTKKLTATFKTSKGKAVKGKKITFNVKGKTYTAKTNAKGVATVKVKLTKKGKYTFKASFAGDDTYSAITKKAKLVLK